MNLFKLVPWFVGIVFVLVISVWGVIGFVFYKGTTAIQEHGVRGVAEHLWCGNDTNCKMPDGTK